MKSLATILLLAGLASSGPAGAKPIQGPPNGTGFGISLSQPDLRPIAGIGVYEIDLFDTPSATIDVLHAAGGYVICYFSAGSWEDWRPDAGNFPKAVVGKEYVGWPGERWLDIRAIESLAPVLNHRLRLAQSKHCDAVDPDNVDGFNADSGFAITMDDQFRFNSWLAEAAHERGLAIGLKNASELVDDLAGAFDFAVVESCFAQDACDDFQRFADQGKAVFQIEYRDDTPDWPAVCTDAKVRHFTAILADLNLDGSAENCPE